MLLGLMLTVKWTEFDAPQTLTVSTRTAPVTTIRMELQGVDDSTLFEDRWKQKYSDWSLAVPIAVAGRKPPQILAKLDRPNWLDFVIYSFEGETIVRAFSFSCRDQKAIRWNVAHGKLVSFETFDRFDPPPERLESTLKRGFRWQRRATYRFDAATGRWRHGKQTWDRYTFGVSPPGQVILSAKDCRFRFAH